MKNSVERRISKAEESTESIQSEGEREAMKKMNKASETTSTSSTSTHVKKNPRRRERVNKYIWRNNCPRLLKSDEKHFIQRSRKLNKSQVEQRQGDTHLIPIKLLKRQG